MAKAIIRTKRISNILADNEAFVESNGYIYRVAMDDHTGDYTLSYHKGMMPAFRTDTFWCIEGLCQEIKTIAPLSHWRHVYNNKTGENMI